MQSTSLFFFPYFPFCKLACSQLADQYGADVVNDILNRLKPQRGKTSTPRATRSPRSSKPHRGNTSTPGATRPSRPSHRTGRNIPLYPFKSRYGQQSGPYLRI